MGPGAERHLFAVTKLGKLSPMPALLLRVGTEYARKGPRQSPKMRVLLSAEILAAVGGVDVCGATEKRALAHFA